MKGKQFNKLTVIGDDFVRGKRHERRWLTQCQCGKTQTNREYDLLKGNCGTCGTKGCKSTMVARHGQSASNLYQMWTGMRYRCEKPYATNYARYGGAGIKVCERWQVFELFAQDMGPRPSKQHSLDRIDGRGHYEPGNVRWATIDEQQSNLANNHVICHYGVTLHVNGWARRTGIAKETIHARLRAGLTGGALFAPPRKQRVFLEWQGTRQSLVRWAAQMGLTYSCVWQRWQKGERPPLLFRPSQRLA